MFGNPAFHGSANKGLDSEIGPKPSDEDIVRALVEIEKTSAKTPLPSIDGRANTRSPFYIGNLSYGDRLRMAIVVAAFLVGVISAGLNLALSYAHRQASSNGLGRSIDSARQARAEQLLQRLASGDSSAADIVITQAPTWLGRTQRTPRANRLLATAINLHDMEARKAALEAELAMDGVPKDASGLDLLTQAAGSQHERAWALWMLGALGNRGIDPVHVAKIIGSYLDDPDANTRAAAVNGLALLGTDETVPMLLDRFRNDPSPIVQERAACAVAESGMYTQAQRIEAAGTLIGWLDDSLVSAQPENVGKSKPCTTSPASVWDRIPQHGGVGTPEFAENSPNLGCLWGLAQAAF